MVHKYQVIARDLDSRSQDCPFSMSSAVFSGHVQSVPKAQARQLEIQNAEDETRCSACDLS